MISHISLIMFRASPHRCEMPGCGKVYAHRSGLTAHIRAAHNGDRPFCCPEKTCNQRFISNSQLREHYERTHKGSHPHDQLISPSPAGQVFDSGRMQPLPMPVHVPVSVPVPVPVPTLNLDVMGNRPINMSGRGQQGSLADIGMLPDVILPTDK